MGLTFGKLPSLGQMLFSSMPPRLHVHNLRSPSVQNSAGTVGIRLGSKVILQCLNSVAVPSTSRQMALVNMSQTVESGQLVSLMLVAKKMDCAAAMNC